MTSQVLESIKIFLCCDRSIFAVIIPAFRILKGYEEATVNLPSQHQASPKKGCSDPAIQTIIQIATKLILIQILQNVWLDMT